MAEPVRKDSIDRFLERALDWFPTLDREVEAAVDRMEKLTKKIDRLTEQTVGRFGLNTGEFKLLLKLRQTPGERASAGRLASSLSLSSGAMTNRIDRLEEAGFVTRERDPEDRRSVVVVL